VDLDISAVDALSRPVPLATCYALESARASGILVQEVKPKGLGAFSTQFITAGDFVGEYHGELLTRCQVQTRYWDMNKKQPEDRRWLKSRRRRKQGLSGDFLFDMGDDLFIDAEDTDLSSWCRFMNHAPEAECNVESRSSPLTVSGGAQKLWYIALFDIHPGHELVLVYVVLYCDDIADFT